jgi:hypothetical protein
MTLKVAHTNHLLCGLAMTLNKNGDSFSLAIVAEYLCEGVMYMAQHGYLLPGYAGLTVCI